MSDTQFQLSVSDSERLSKATHSAAFLLDDLRSLARCENPLLQQIAMLQLRETVNCYATLAQSSMCCELARPLPANA